MVDSGGFDHDLSSRGETALIALLLQSFWLTFWFKRALTFAPNWRI
jgi:hypothetical protein